MGNRQSGQCPETHHTQETSVLIHTIQEVKCPGFTLHTGAGALDFHHTLNFIQNVNYLLISDTLSNKIWYRT